MRYDHASSSYPESTLGPTTYAPNRNLTFPETQILNWNDITPKMGFAYDLLGNGKTALKISLNKYLQGVRYVVRHVPDPNPFPQPSASAMPRAPGTTPTTTTFPDCDLTNRTPGANGECGPLSDPHFGSNNVRRSEPAQVRSESRRPAGASASTTGSSPPACSSSSAARVSLDIGFFRRWYGNFQVVDNLSLRHPTSTTSTSGVPADSRLPGGGNYTVTGFPVVKPTVDSAASSEPERRQAVGRRRQADRALERRGRQPQCRLQNGFIAQGGFSTGRTSTDNCAIIAKLPEAAFESYNFFSPFFFLTIPTQYCKRDGVFLTQVKGRAAYIMPKLDVVIAGTYQDLPGVDVTARYNVPFLPNVGGLQMLPGLKFSRKHRGAKQA